MKTYLNLVEETINYYESGQFGYDNQSDKCVYFGNHGEMCAVGRCLNNPELLKNETLNGDHVISNNLGGGLKIEYLHLNNPDFWQKLQYWHDFAASSDPNTGRYLEDVLKFAEELDNK